MSRLCKVFTAAAALQESPGDHLCIGRRDSQLLHGEEFRVEEIKNGWARGVSLLDGYEGWVKLEVLREAARPATHAVDTRMTQIYPAPNFKTYPGLTLSFMSRVIVSGEAVDGFVPVNDEKTAWVPEGHLIALKDRADNPRDIVDTALSFEGTPYIYGGRAAWGLDCSALVQLAAQRNGVFCPRDTDQQVAMLGESVGIEEIQRGDIVYFPGHVGIMVDRENCLNATMRHMRTVIEPLAHLERIYEHDEGEPILDVRRLDFAV